MITYIVEVSSLILVIFGQLPLSSADNRTITTIERKEDGLLVTLTFWLYAYAPLGVLAIGITGNVLSFILLSQNQYNSSSTCFYMKMLTVFDSAYLISSMISDHFTTWSNPSFVYRLFFCALLRSFRRVSQAVSSTLLTAMSVDRLLAVAVPLKAKIWGNVGRANVVTCIILVVITAVHSPVSFIRSYITHEANCGLHKTSFWTHIYANFRLITVFYGPLIVLFISNVGIICIVKINIRRRRKHTGAGHEKEGYITLMLLAVTISSFVCLLPFQLVKVYYRYIYAGSFDQKPVLVYNFINSFAGFFQYCNYGMNLYAYTLPIAKFRRELSVLIHCQK
jgi:hypothetical protein